MAEKTPQELLQIDFKPPKRDWMDPSVDFASRKGTWSYQAQAKHMEHMGFPHARAWSPFPVRRAR